MPPGLAAWRAFLDKGDSIIMADKFRYFQFLVYPQSAPADWEKILEDSLGDYAISPVHNGDDDISKPHHHVIYKHGNPCSLDFAKSVIPSVVPANGYVEPCMHPGNAQRYLIHLDQPEKEQFPGGVNAIRVLNGFPLDLTRELTKIEKQEIRSKCFAWIVDNSILEYAEFLDSLLELGNPDMFDYAFNHTIAFNAYLKSRRYGGITS